MPRRGIPPLLAVGLLAVAGCEMAAPPLPPMPPPDVVVTPVTVETVTESEEFYGKTRAEKEVDIRAHVTGYLDQANFKEGAVVHKNDVLFQIDPRPFAAEVERNEANVAQAEAHVKRLEYDFGRAERMILSKGMSREEYDKTVGDLAEARAALKSAIAARRTAKLNLDYCTVLAPFDGRISRRSIDPGNMVKADDTILTQLVTIDPMLAYFDIDERTFLRIQRFLEGKDAGSTGRRQVEVTMALADEKGYPHKGTVDFVDNRVDPDSGSVWLRGRFPNKDGQLTSGLFARVRLPLGDPHTAVLIDKKALATDQGQKYVYYLDEDFHDTASEPDAEKAHALYCKVRLGADLGDRQEVVAATLDPDDANKWFSPDRRFRRVITAGLQRVRIPLKQHFAEVHVVTPEADEGTKAGPK
jgi:multidrug efflux system membrane fusion protein